MVASTPDNCAWYAMRSLFRTELKTKSRLEAAGIRCFLPMKESLAEVDGKKKCISVPVVSNLIFVYSNPVSLAPLMRENSKFQFIFKRGGKENEPLVVPEREMENFIRAVESSSCPIYFTPDELDVAIGTRIRVFGGILDGVEGILMKVKGARARRLVVEIPGTVAVAVEINPDLVQVLP